MKYFYNQTKTIIILVLLFFIFKHNLISQEQLLPPNLIFPEHQVGYETVPDKFVWNEVDDAKYYSIQITNDVTFLELDFASDILIDNYSDTIFIPDANKIIVDTMYFWRVKAYNDTTESEWSFIRMFLTGYSSIAEDNNKVQILPMPIKEYAKIILENYYDDLKCFIVTYSGILLVVKSFSMNDNIIDIRYCLSGSYYFVITSHNKIIANKSVIID